ncbi:uncharacterized protein LOC132194740 [Neocloeon triangulifer]|uniref:uncharacterized protein LOC132194740 n=1 Tax=Neocloeon triangulifer TaxID=2078957 RepID=UPI00286F4515|nr:uncharacterized protein LOC132194740 [Neocloeon triangulifer]
MPSLGCQQGFKPFFDLDSTEHSVRTEPSISQELLNYLVKNVGQQVSDLQGRPVIRTTAAADSETEPRGAPATPPGPQSHICRIDSRFRDVGNRQNSFFEGPLEEAVSEQGFTKFISTTVPWDMCANLCRAVDQFFQQECQIAGVLHLGAACRISPRSTPFGANLIFSFRFPCEVPPHVTNRLMHSVTEHIRANTAGAPIQNAADFPTCRPAFHTSSNFYSPQKNSAVFTPDIQLYSDEILLKSSL